MGTDVRSPEKPRMNERLRRLELVRRRIPYAVWLVYDVIFAALLLYGLRFSPWFMVGFPFLAGAVFFDVIEFIVKGMESSWLKRLAEGTGPPK